MSNSQVQRLIDGAREANMESAMRDGLGRVSKLTRENEHLRAEIARLNAWVADLQSGMYVNCVYCGHRYGPADKVPATMADALKAHIEQCPEHPMSALRAENEKLRKALEELVYLKDMKERLQRLHEMGHGTDYDIYHRRKPMAWAAARATLAAGQPQQEQQQ